MISVQSSASLYSWLGHRERRIVMLWRWGRMCKIRSGFVFVVKETQKASVSSDFFLLLYSL